MAFCEYDTSILNELFQEVELRVGCYVCAPKEEEITFSIKTTEHKCQENLLIAKLKNTGKCWRPISARPKYPQPMRYDVCWFFVEGIGCTVHGRRCTFARSREEALTWDFMKKHFLDLESLISLLGEIEQTVSNLEGVSEKILTDWCGEFQELCRECFYGSPRKITERGSSYVCGTQMGHPWKPMMVHSLAPSPGNCVFSEIRPLPPDASLQLCCRDTIDKSTGHSPLECQFAHSEVELAVWKQEVNSEWNRRELLWLSQQRKQPQRSNEGQSHATTLNTANDSNDKGVPEPVENETSYQDLILKEYRDSGKTIVIMSEHVDDVDITHDEDLYLECPEVGTEINWSFQIKTERLLSHVALLKNEPGAKFNLGDGIHNKTCTYSAGKTFEKSGLCYEVPVTFTSSLPGLYEQWLVLDFDMRPVLLQKLKVRVGENILELEEALETIDPTLERWHKGNRDIIPYFPHLLSKTQDALLKTYELPQKNFGVGKAEISRQNYKEMMHRFLFKEEFVEAEIVSRLDFRETMTLSNNFRSPYKVIDLHVHSGESFGILPFSFALIQNTPEGVLFKRQVESVLVGEVTSNDQSQKVYEAVILRNTDSVNEIHLRLSRDCCSELRLQKGQTRKMEVQFQLNRLQFCEMHKAIDLLTDLDKVLPDFTKSCVPSHSTKYPSLNANQQAAMEFILGDADGNSSVAPLLIYGPFGTGKTFTLASAAKEVVCQSGGRVLICTHTNSSADIYVSRHFNKYFKDGCHEVKPLRIKANKGGKALKNTDKITLKYCYLSRDGQSFMFPTRTDLDSHLIVIITTSWAKHLHDMSLPKDYFSHIMIDEASQMLECEALMALGLAGPKTRVVLAGDHMQMGPKLFSVEDHKHSDHTLLNRLFSYYQSERKNVALESRIIFNENYRSNKEIVNFVSKHFYTGKKDSIRACGNVLAHPKHYPLRFHHVRGECHLHPKSQSWYNLEEVERVVCLVRELLDDWPSNVWEPQKAEDICILSTGHQLQVMKKELKKQQLTGVSVQSLLNVQGKQFRVIVMTTVQTRDQLLLSSTSCLEFFNDARVLNTAMTRTQSEVIVVGDAAALCFFGKCSKIWECYIALCMKKGSIQPDHLTEGFLKKEVEEISKFYRPESDVEVEDTPLIEEDRMDQILEEMIIDYAAENSSEQSDTESETDSNCPSHPRRSYRRPSAHRQGALALQTLSIGRTIRPAKASECEKGIGIVGESFVCILEDDFQHRGQRKENGHVQKVMVPINKGGTKISVLRQKNRHNFLPIWKLESGVWSIIDYKHIDEHLRQRHVFIVQVICWKDHCIFPLGNVTDVHPVGTTIDEGLLILDAKFKLKQLPDSNDIVVEMNDEDIKNLEEIKTFTIDPYKASHMDDAISVSDLGSHYEVGIHITDVASFLNKGDTLDKVAEERGGTYYRTKCGKKPIFMFPESVSTDHWSLGKEKVRRVISLICKVNKTTGSVIKRWQLSRIKSNWKLCYEDVESILSNSDTLKALLSNKSAKDLTFTTQEDFIALAYYFSQTQRKERLPKDWTYSQPRKHQTPGRRRSHLMVEELNILFNHEMSRLLIKDGETKSCTPLRCQKPPSKSKISELRERHMDLIPMSAHLKHHLGCNEQDLEDRPFTVLSSVWNNIQEAAQSGQYDMMADLIGTDDLYPQLLPIISAFRDVQNKAYIICSNSCEEAKVGHYSLAVDSYSKASSPLRRYMDIVLQRLFHAVHSHSCVQYSQPEIHSLCGHFKKINQKIEEYEKQAETISLSTSLKKQSASKCACIVSVKPEEGFIVSFPFNKGLLPEKLSILYRDLLLDDQPRFDVEKKHVELKWRRQLYTLHTPNVQAKLRELKEGNTCINISQKTWHEIVLAIQKEDWTLATTLISECKTSRVEKHKAEAFVLTQGDIVQVQLTAVRHNGFWAPRAQLLYVDTDFVVCMEHAQRPMDCFAKQAEYYTKNFFDDIEEYVKIWMPLCQMVSATTAVEDSDRITIENVPIIWKLMKKGNLTGSFSLPIKCIKEWNIEFNLAQCYLCIKKKNLKLQLGKGQEDDVGDPCIFTWVAHGWVTSCEETGKKSESPSKIVKFYINHRSMDQVPEDIRKTDAVFSIELIPKLSPDIRTENAINNTVKANDLVKKIALGWQIKADASVHILKYNIVRNERPDGLPELNESQYSAVQQAVNNSFTLIQGPPGTGKTIVGAYIVYWFSKYLLGDQETEDKKEVVLYCGPSNKSVDVVAEYLLRFKDSLKPLRVYSRQIESQDFPLPANTRQLSQKSRQEKSSPQLRSITLHHRIRSDENPYSEDIKTFDEKIQRQDEKEGEERIIDEKEIEEYKELLIKAREYELKRHDLILCTCTAASSANLTKAISAKMILIDECAMATEPQALVPLVSYNPQKIVLLGDHKQLRPVVRNERAKRMGMSRSLFERCITSHAYEEAACSLNIQYRMHTDICEFPSKHYYGGKLKTVAKCGESVLQIGRPGLTKTTRIAFVDIRGKEIIQIVSTNRGNEKSVANIEESIEAIQIAEALVSKGNVNQEDIAILSPYNAQVSDIKGRLLEKKLTNITVCTITKSQGSEWRYVIMSVVRSCSSEEIKADNTREWRSKHIGFVGDANQINVGITRAKDGLCILGNQQLLDRSLAWQKLLKFYTTNNCVVNEVSVCEVTD